MSENTSSTDIGHNEPHSIEELNKIKEKRETLEKIVKISLTISRLQTGLESVVMMGKPSSNVPQSAIRLYHSLSEAVLHYSNLKIQTSLSAVEDKIKNNIVKVIKVAQVSNEITEDETDSEDFDDLNKLLHEFRRRAQTAVALNLLLRKRGVTPKELSFHLPEDLINSTIHNLYKQELECKSEIQDRITEVQSDINMLLKSDSLPDTIREEVLAMKDSFAKNLDHLKSGKTMEDMPIVIEMVEIGSMENHSTLYKHDTASEENKNISSKVEPSEKHNKMKRGFFSRTKEWMTTPFDTKWNDIE